MKCTLRTTWEQQRIISLKVVQGKLYFSSLLLEKTGLAFCKIRELNKRFSCSQLPIYIKHMWTTPGLSDLVSIIFLATLYAQVCIYINDLVNQCHDFTCILCFQLQKLNCVVTRILEQDFYLHRTVEKINVKSNMKIISCRYLSTKQCLKFDWEFQYF